MKHMKKLVVLLLALAVVLGLAIGANAVPTEWGDYNLVTGTINRSDKGERWLIDGEHAYDAIYVNAGVQCGTKNEPDSFVVQNGAHLVVEGKIYGELIIAGLDTTVEFVNDGHIYGTVKLYNCDQDWNEYGDNVTGTVYVNSGAQLYFNDNDAQANTINVNGGYAVVGGTVSTAGEEPDVTATGTSVNVISGHAAIYGAFEYVSGDVYLYGQASALVPSQKVTIYDGASTIHPTIFDYETLDYLYDVRDDGDYYNSYAYYCWMMDQITSTLVINGGRHTISDNVVTLMADYYGIDDFRTWVEIDNYLLLDLLDDFSYEAPSVKIPYANIEINEVNAAVKTEVTISSNVELGTGRYTDYDSYGMIPGALFLHQGTLEFNGNGQVRPTGTALFGGSSGFGTAGLAELTALFPDMDIMVSPIIGASMECYYESRELPDEPFEMIFDYNGDGELINNTATNLNVSGQFRRIHSTVKNKYARLLLLPMRLDTRGVYDLGDASLDDDVIILEGGSEGSRDLIEIFGMPFGGTLPTATFGEEDGEDTQYYALRSYLLPVMAIHQNADVELVADAQLYYGTLLHSCVSQVYLQGTLTIDEGAFIGSDMMSMPVYVGIFDDEAVIGFRPEGDDAEPTAVLINKNEVVPFNEDDYDPTDPFAEDDQLYRAPIVGSFAAVQGPVVVLGGLESDTAYIGDTPDGESADLVLCASSLIVNEGDYTVSSLLQMGDLIDANATVTISADLANADDAEWLGLGIELGYYDEDENKMLGENARLVLAPGGSLSEFDGPDGPTMAAKLGTIELKEGHLQKSGLFFLGEEAGFIGLSDVQFVPILSFPQTYVNIINKGDPIMLGNTRGYVAAVGAFDTTLVDGENATLRLGEQYDLSSSNTLLLTCVLEKDSKPYNTIKTTVDGKVLLESGTTIDFAAAIVLGEGDSIARLAASPVRYGAQLYATNVDFTANCPIAEAPGDVYDLLSSAVIYITEEEPAGHAYAELNGCNVINTATSGEAYGIMNNGELEMADTTVENANYLSCFAAVVNEGIVGAPGEDGYPLTTNCVIRANAEQQAIAFMNTGIAAVDRSLFEGDIDNKYLFDCYGNTVYGDVINGGEGSDELVEFTVMPRWASVEKAKVPTCIYGDVDNQLYGRFTADNDDNTALYIEGDVYNNAKNFSGIAAEDAAGLFLNGIKYSEHVWDPFLEEHYSDSESFSILIGGDIISNASRTDLNNVRVLGSTAATKGTNRIGDAVYIDDSVALKNTVYRIADASDERVGGHIEINGYTTFEIGQNLLTDIELEEQKNFKRASLTVGDYIAYNADQITYDMGNPAREAAFVNKGNLTIKGTNCEPATGAVLVFKADDGLNVTGMLNGVVDIKSGYGNNAPGLELYSGKGIYVGKNAGVTLDVDNVQGKLTAIDAGLYGVENYGTFNYKDGSINVTRGEDDTARGIENHGMLIVGTHGYENSDRTYITLNNGVGINNNGVNGIATIYHVTIVTTDTSAASYGIRTINGADTQVLAYGHSYKDVDNKNEKADVTVTAGKAFSVDDKGSKWAIRGNDAKFTGSSAALEVMLASANTQYCTADRCDASFYANSADTKLYEVKDKLDLSGTTARPLSGGQFNGAVIGKSGLDEKEQIMANVAFGNFYTNVASVTNTEKDLRNCLDGTTTARTYTLPDSVKIGVEIKQDETQAKADLNVHGLEGLIDSPETEVKDRGSLLVKADSTVNIGSNSISFADEERTDPIIKVQGASSLTINGNAEEPGTIYGDIYANGADVVLKDVKVVGNIVDAKSVKLNNVYVDGDVATCSGYVDAEDSEINGKLTALGNIDLDSTDVKESVISNQGYVNVDDCEIGWSIYAQTTISAKDSNVGYEIHSRTGSITVDNTEVGSYVKTEALNVEIKNGSKVSGDVTAVTGATINNSEVTGVLTVSGQGVATIIDSVLGTEGVEATHSVNGYTGGTTTVKNSSIYGDLVVANGDAKFNHVEENKLKVVESIVDGDVTITSGAAEVNDYEITGRLTALNDITVAGSTVAGGIYCTGTTYTAEIKVTDSTIGAEDLTNDGIQAEYVKSLTVTDSTVKAANNAIAVHTSSALSDGVNINHSTIESTNEVAILADCNENTMNINGSTITGKEVAINNDGNVFINNYPVEGGDPVKSVVNGKIISDGNVYVFAGSDTDDIESDGLVDVDDSTTGNITAYGDVTADNATTGNITSTNGGVEVTDAETGAIQAYGDVTVDNSTTEGITTSNGGVEVKNDSETGAIQAYGDVTVDDSTTEGITTSNGGVDVSESETGNIMAKNDVSVYKSSTGNVTSTNGDVTVDSAVEVGIVSATNGSVEIKNTTTGQNIQAGESVLIDNSEVDSVNAAGTYVVVKDSEVHGVVTAANDATITNSTVGGAVSSTVAGNVLINGASETGDVNAKKGNVTITEASEVGNIRNEEGNVEVTGASEAGNVTALKGDINVNGESTVQIIDDKLGNVTVTGKSDAGVITADKGNVTVSGASTVGNILDKEGNVEVKSKSTAGTITNNLGNVTVSSGSTTGAITADDGDVTVQGSNDDPEKVSIVNGDVLVKKGSFKMTNTGTTVKGNVTATTEAADSVSITGASEVTGTLTVNGAGSVNISVATIDGAAEFNNTGIGTIKNNALFNSTVKINGTNDMTVESATFKDDVTVTAGDLIVNNGVFEKDLAVNGGTATLNDGTYNTMTIGTSGNATVNGGAFSGTVDNSGIFNVPAASTGVFNGQVLLKNGTSDIQAGTFNNDVNASGGTNSISGGTFAAGKTVTLSGGTKNTISGGTFNGKVTVSNGSENIISGGTFNETVDVTGGTKNTISGGTFEKKVSVSNGAANTISGGSFKDDVQISGGTNTITGGTFMNVKPASTPAKYNTLSITGGTVEFNSAVNAIDRAVTVTAGNVTVTNYEFAKPVTVTGGNVTVKNGKFDDNVLINGSAKTNIYDGTFMGYVTVDKNAVVNIYGGTFNQAVGVLGGTVNTNTPPVVMSGADQKPLFNSIVYENDGDVTIKAGTFKGAVTVTNGHFDVVNGKFDSTLTISGTTTGKLDLISGGVFNDNVTFTSATSTAANVAITGGTYAAGKTVTVSGSAEVDVKPDGAVFNSDVAVKGSGDLDISGSSFTGDITVSETGDLAVTGGSFAAGKTILVTDSGKLDVANSTKVDSAVVKDSAATKNASVKLHVGTSYKQIQNKVTGESIIYMVAQDVTCIQDTVLGGAPVKVNVYEANRALKKDTNLIASDSTSHLLLRGENVNTVAVADLQQTENGTNGTAYKYNSNDNLANSIVVLDRVALRNKGYSFTLTPAITCTGNDISARQIEWTVPTGFTLSGEALKGFEKDGASYFSFEDNAITVNVPADTAPGTYTITCKSVENPAKTIQYKVKVEKTELSNVSPANVTIAFSNDTPSVVYNGQEQHRSITSVKVEVNGAKYEIYDSTIVSGHNIDDFDIKAESMANGYATYKNVGKYKMFLDATNKADCTGIFASVEWEITPKPVTVAVIAANQKAGTGFTTVTSAYITSGLINPDVVTVDTSEAIAQIMETTAGENRLVHVTGLKLTGTDAKNYMIDTNSQGYIITYVTLTGASLNDPSVTVNLNKTSFVYDGNTKSVTVTVKNGTEVLAAGEDYEITGTTSAIDPNTYSVTVTGKGYYSGSVTKTWDIVEKSVPTGGGGGGGGSSKEHFDIDVEGEDVAPEQKTATEGTTVIIDLGDDVTIDDIVVKDADGNVIKVRSAGSGKASFTMPGSDVTVTVLEKSSYANCPKDATCVLEKFDDLTNDKWYHDGIHFCVEEGLMNGISSSVFGPDDTTTRGMIVTMLARMNGVTITSTGVEWYADGRDWAMEFGVSDGTNMTGAITREQLVTMLYRYAVKKGYDVSARANIDRFNDADEVSSYAVEAMRWAVAVGIVGGYADNTIQPTGTATRAEVATMFMRFCEYVVK